MGSHTLRSSLRIFSRYWEVQSFCWKTLCVCYTIKKAAYRSFPQWEIMAFVAFCLEEFAFALQEKYNRISYKARGPRRPTFVDLSGLLFTKISKVVSKVCPPRCHDIMQREWRTPSRFLKFDCWIEIQNLDRISIGVLAGCVFSKPCRKYTKRVLQWTGTDSSQFSEKIGTTVPIPRNIAVLSCWDAAALHIL